MSRAKTIRCQNVRDGKVCNNIICVRDGDTLSFKRHGREISGVHITVDFPVKVKCERCGKATVLTTQNQ